jgi:hypothetical protein
MKTTLKGIVVGLLMAGLLTAMVPGTALSQQWGEIRDGAAWGGWKWVKLPAHPSTGEVVFDQDTGLCMGWDGRHWNVLPAYDPRYPITPSVDDVSGATGSPPAGTPESDSLFVDAGGYWWVWNRWYGWESVMVLIFGGIHPGGWFVPQQPLPINHTQLPNGTHPSPAPGPRPVTSGPASRPETGPAPVAAPATSGTTQTATVPPMKWDSVEQCYVPATSSIGTPAQNQPKVDVEQGRGGGSSTASTPNLRYLMKNADRSVRKFDRPILLNPPSQPSGGSTGNAGGMTPIRTVDRGSGSAGINPMPAPRPAAKAPAQPHNVRRR